MSSSSNINILYLTWGEFIDLNGLMGNQVFRQLIKIKALRNDLNVFILTGVPYLSKSRLFEKKQSAGDLKYIIEYLDTFDVKLKIKNVWVLPRWFYTKICFAWLYYIFYITYLRDFIVENKIDLIHCRSYHAAYLALKVKNKFKLQVRIIFDTRGLFPEEGVSHGWYRYNSRSYRMWKRREQLLLEESDMIVNVSDNFTGYIKSITENRKVSTIYTSVDLDTFYRDNNLKKTVRAQLGLATGEKVLIYIGSIGITGWHQLETLLNLYKAFELYFIKTRLLIVTQSPHNPIRDNLSEFGLKKREYYLFESKTAEQTNSYLNAADYASFPYRKITSRVDSIISKTVLATKTGEYLAVGLPILVNDNVGEAALLVERYRLGSVYKAGQETAIADALAAIENDYKNISSNCVDVAKECFSSDVNARKYLTIYEELAGKSKYKGN